MKRGICAISVAFLTGFMWGCSTSGQAEKEGLPAAVAAPNPAPKAVPQPVWELITPYRPQEINHALPRHIDPGKSWDLLVRFRTTTHASGSFQPTRDAVVLDAQTNAPKLAYISEEDHSMNQRIEVRDFDCDGVSELVQHHYISGTIYRLDNGHFNKEIPVRLPELASERFEAFRRNHWEFCDVDSDGICELIVVGSGDSMVCDYRDGEFRYVEVTLHEPEKD